MIRYIVRRILFLIPILFGVAVLIFSVIRLAPGDPAEIILGPMATQEEIAQLRESMGLNKPLYQQFFAFVSGAVRGDLGRSLRTGNTVMEEIAGRIPVSVQLALLSTFFSILVGFPLGMLAALKQNTLADTACSFLALAGFSIPNFWLGLMLMLVFSIYIPVLPSSGYETWGHLILPTVVLGSQTMAVVARMTRSSMLEIIRQDYVRTAKAKGISDRLVLTRHIVRNALIPVVTVVGLYFGTALGGVVVTETVFSIPGIGRLLVDAIRSQDYPMVQGGVLFFAFCIGIVNLGVDIVYAFLDPRIKAQYR